MMKKSLHIQAAMLCGAALLASSGLATAQTNSRIIARPAVLVAPVAAATAAVPAAQPTTASRRGGVIIVTPAPLPPLPPNSCFRGNSAGVTRC